MNKWNLSSCHFYCDWIKTVLFRMGNPATFNAFLINVAGLIVPRVQNKISGFDYAFCALLSLNEKELDTFVSTMHSSNSVRANNVWIVIPSGAVIILKSLLFELKDRNRCDALPSLVMLQNLDIVQMSVLCAQRNQTIQDEEKSKGG